MKNFISLFFAILLTIEISSAAEILKARAVTPISTKNPTEDITVEALNDVLVQDFQITKGYILYGKMIDIVQPQKMGKNASFAFKIIGYEDLKNEKHSLTTPLTLNYRQQMHPNYRRSSITLGDENGSGLVFSMHDIDLMKESKGVGDFLKKEAIKDSFLDTGWQIELKKNDSLKFNLPQ